MRPAQEIIKRPLLTEKSTRLRETGGGDSTYGEDETYAKKVVFEVARDAPFYEPTITEEMVGHISRFAREIGALEGEVRYEALVPSQFAGLWKG